MISVVIADDQAVVRTGFTTILESEPDISVIAQATDGGHAVRTARRERPDVVLMDVRMPGTDGLTATRQLAGPDVEDPVTVLVITTFDLDDYVFGALQAGASGFLLKDIDPDDLVRAVRTVADGQGLVAPQVTRRLIEEFARRRPAPTGRAEAAEILTDRELATLRLMAAGHSNAEIAGAHFVELSTVKSHVAGILTKTGARDRVQAVIWAYEHGVVSPG